MNDVSADRRPYVVLSVAMSIDGHIDDRSPERLLLSSPEDFDRVDQLRADSDAVLVGAGTLRSDDPRLATATLYSTLEPCSRRSSHPVPCAQLIRASALRRVVIAWREPALFVADCEGVELLEQAGITVLECPELAPAARAVNSYLELG